MGPFGRGESSDPRYARRGGGVRWWVLLVFGAYLGYYYLTHRQEASFTGRQQMLDASMDQEVALGLQSFQQILQQSDQVTDPAVVQPIQEIARRLKKAREEVWSYREYYYIVRNDDLKQSLKELESIFIAERIKTKRLDIGWLEANFILDKEDKEGESP